MDYRQAVNLAKAGKEEGFQFLYESTYKSKYYLALKYLKDEQAAQDVLQEAYIKAFAKLDSLEQPERFPAWLGVIVGNLAKNKLQKKNPLLFSDIAVNDEDESFAYEIEDENPNYQPELSYSKQETQQLVHEMINALSEEQRVCILMYEIEGIPIREIAAALGCSENTVKSRLNYGRKNLKKKAEELQKRGYKLYGVSALPLLLWLLRREESDLLADGVLEMAQSRAAGQIFSHAGTEETFGAKAADAAQNVWESGRTAAAGAAKKGFLHTVAGKVTAVLVSLAVVGGAAGDGEAQPRAAAVAPARRIGAVEAVEDAGDVLAADADAGILHLDGGPAVLRATGAQADDAAGGRVLGGIVAEDAAALLEHIAVGEGQDVLLRVDAPVVVAVDELGILVDLLDQFGDVQKLHVQTAAAHVAAGEEEQLIDELFHVLALGLDGGDALVKHLFIALAPAVEHGGVALNDGDGRAQFVRGVGDELALPLVGFVQARKQAVDGLFETAQVAVAGAQRFLRGAWT